MHPLIDVTKFNDEELLEKMNDLYSKMGAASLNQVAYKQLTVIYKMFSEEFNRRQKVAWESQSAKYEESLKIVRKPRVRRNHREKPE